jgi:hypothetical protein
MSVYTKKAMVITDAKYIDGGHPIPGVTGEGNCAILATINGVVMGVPLDNRNRHYAEIMRQVDAGELTIAPADNI